MTPAEVLGLLKEKEAKFVDLRFTDTRGKEQHVTVPAKLIDAVAASCDVKPASFRGGISTQGVSGVSAQWRRTTYSPGATVRFTRNSVACTPYR